MINYLEIIGTYYPTTQAYTNNADLSNYNNIIWSSTQIQKSELDNLYILELKNKKIMLISSIVNSEISSGFYSSALGSPMVYDSKPEDQLNLIGAVSSQSDMYYSCRPSTKGSIVVNFNNSITNNYPTGLLNNNTIYSFVIVIDSISNSINVVGSTAQTFEQLITQILNTNNLNDICDINITDGNFTITSKKYGYLSNVNIIDTNLFTNLNGFVNILNPVNGINASPKVFKQHTHQQLLQVLNDGKNIKLQILQEFLKIKNLILSATSEEDINSINWIPINII